MAIFTLFTCSAWNTSHEGDLVCQIFFVHAPACVCSSLITSALLPQVFPQRQQSSLHAALQFMEREEFAGSPEKGKLCWNCKSKEAWLSAEATWVYRVCVSGQSLAHACAALQELWEGLAEIGLLWILWLTQSLSLPSCHTQQFSEYRNSHAGILADWFSVLTEDSKKSRILVKKEAKWRSGQDSKSQWWTGQRVYMEDKCWYMPWLKKTTDSNKDRAGKRKKTLWCSHCHDLPEAPLSRWHSTYPLALGARVCRMCVCVWIHATPSTDFFLKCFPPQLGFDKSLFVNDNTTAVHRSMQVIEWVWHASGEALPSLRGTICFWRLQSACVQILKAQWGQN